MNRFIDFLDEKCTIAAAQAAAYKSKLQVKREEPSKKKSMAFVSQGKEEKVASKVPLEKKKVTCMLCDEDHPAKACKKDLSLW